MLARTRAGCVVGVAAVAVDVEVHLSKGLPGFDLVGLPETAVRESRVRVRAALANQGYSLPPRRVTLSLAPADLRKRGASLDLAIAVALLSACGSCPPNRLEETLLFGELSLSGELRPSRGLLPQLRDLRSRGVVRAIVPRDQLTEGALVSDIDVRGAHDLADVVAFLASEIELPRAASVTPSALAEVGPRAPDLMEVRGQMAAKRALEIAAAGAHPILMIGPPGAGKTMLARRLPGILPAPTPPEALAIATIASAAGLPRPTRRPFRAPHHTASPASLVGGGDPVRPGEVTLAHLGVLFLDELPEFSRASIESFRVILESGESVISRVRERVTMPARPLVVAAMNPCPCGYDGDPTRLCRCTPARVAAYRGKVSGPMLDRFALHIALPPVRLRELRAMPKPEEGSEVIRGRVQAARERLRDAPVAQQPTALLDRLPSAARELLIDAGEAMGLSMRSFAHAARVARTIAALDDADEVALEHVAEALAYRLVDARSEVVGRQSSGRDVLAPRKERVR
ncbi:MAG: YifB family Mg chelatase-like AAA ATPase [Sandaracinaceae bacterium]